MMNAPEHPGPEQPANSRATRADQYFERDLEGQLLWYSKRASAYKRLSQVLSILVLAAGALTTLVQVLPQTPWTSITPWVPIITAGLGAFVVVCEGWMRISRHTETWAGYRAASERMKREKRLFVNGAGPYRDLDDGKAYLQFVESIEAILAEEQQTFWRERRSEPRADHPSNAAVPAGKEPSGA